MKRSRVNQYPPKPRVLVRLGCTAGVPRGDCCKATLQANIRIENR